MKQEKSCGVIVYRQEDNRFEYLLLKSKKHGEWGFPKGHVENSETEYETATREVLEESGLNVSIIDGLRISIEYLIEGNVNKEVVYFAGSTVDQEVNIQKSEVSDYAWVSLNDALNMLAFEALRKVLLKVDQFLR